MANIYRGVLCEPVQMIEAEPQVYSREDHAPTAFDGIERQRGLNLPRDVLP
jgi:hypothetical protein